jgi:SAM-dependent methyltransferase
LLDLLPPAPARIAEMGSGTGTLSVLLADEGYVVDGVDFSPEMVKRAEGKAAGRPGLRFVEADASRPPLEAGSYDAVLCRHVLWAMPHPADALRRWTALLAGHGALVLVEGRWGNGAGLDADHVVALVEGLGRAAVLTRLHDARYWGRDIDDDRYVVLSRS